jgi:hypothetical protein
MGFGRILGYAALGVGAIAAAPFTGGGSILAATGAAASLAGAGTVAAAVGAGAVGAVAGAIANDEEKAEKEKAEKEKAKLNKKTEKAEKIASDHEEHTKIILALSAMGCAMANANGHISQAEKNELNEFIGGLASENYPKHIVEQIEFWNETPPTFNEGVEHLKKVEFKDYKAIREMLVMVMEADDEIHKEKRAFLSAFDIKVEELIA